MFQIDTADSVNGLFVEGDPQVGQDATTVSADWLNAVQEEIVNAVEGGGLELDKQDSTQLLQAINALISAQQAVPVGYCAGFSYRQTGAAQITLAGAVEVNGEIFYFDGDTAVDLAPVANQWNFILAAAGAAGELAAGDISISTTTPTQNPAKGNQYYSVDGTKRCLGYFPAPSGSIPEFDCEAGWWFYRQTGNKFLDTTSPQTSKTAIWCDLPPLDKFLVALKAEGADSDDAYSVVGLYNGDDTIGGWNGSRAAPTFVISFDGATFSLRRTNTSQEVQYASYRNGTHVYLYNQGHVVPAGLPR